MNIFSAIAAKIREVFRKMIPYQTIEQAERIETPLSTDMVNALNKWYQLYLNKASWLNEDVKSLNLPAFISSEIARSVVIEMKWNITGTGLSEDGEEISCIYAWGSAGGGWPTSDCAFFIGVWNEGKKDGKLVQYEVDVNYGTPNSMWGPMFGAPDNPVVTTGWGKIVDMTCLDAE